MIFSFLTPEFLNKFAQSCAEAPSPLITTFTLSISFLEISKALISAAVVYGCAVLIIVKNWYI